MNDKGMTMKSKEMAVNDKGMAVKNKEMAINSKGGHAEESESFIRLKHVKKLYYPGTKREIAALKGIDLDIEKGEIFGVIGYSGAGKSTLIRLINALEKPTDGEVWVGGVNMATLTGDALRRKRMKIGMIFQHFNLLWSRTALENVLFPLELAGWPRARATQRARELLDIVSLSHRKDAYPARLSGGEKQRVGIARALANEPDLLLSDEATSALDPKTTDDILELLLSINRTLGITIVLITHEMRVIEKICDRVAVLDEGVIKEVGRVRDVFAKPQSAIAKRFVAEALDAEDVLMRETARGPVSEPATDRLLTSSGETRRWRLIFVGEVAERPVITELIRQHAVEINILRGEIKRLKDTPFGTLTVEVSGRLEDIQKARRYLEQTGVIIEPPGEE
ncbi:MAG: Methionine ABC transporter ATP-binding protein [Candidatus Carbobacillus altaicus]|uniref:Methionine ABC transporter ATP-binding protein n=1 Tax=Candidatus Carbonibacillus altaicus TaxID=2163959 RepID=A0A2R6Y3G7_9BACL|nr:MAG: Methionine ABC transporter ATP-binding protein [Candidatus Carbobacillus altaicus]